MALGEKKIGKARKKDGEGRIILSSSMKATRKFLQINLNGPIFFTAHAKGKSG